MKRHPALAHFSRDHHKALIAAQLIKKDAPAYRGLPETIEGKREYMIRFFNEHLKDHFANEEKLLFHHSKNIDPEIDKLIDDLTGEHRIIESLIKNLEASQETELNLDRLGILMESHIRKEERILFEKVQELLSEEKLNEIESLRQQFSKG